MSHAQNTLHFLSLEVLRCTIAFLDAVSLAKLLCTFDGQVHRILSSSGALPEVIIPQNARKVHGMRHLLATVRNVSRLSFESGTRLDPGTLALLATLNPLKLAIKTNFLSDSVIKLLEESKHSPNDAHLRSQTKFLLPNGLPDFSRLTTRLESLVLDIPLGPSHYTSGKREFNEIRLPSTLTDLNIDNSNMFIPFAILPSNLRSLTLNTVHIKLQEVFNHFTSLEVLVIRSVEAWQLGDSATGAMTFPATLHTIIGYTVMLPSAFISHPSLLSSSIATISISARDAPKKPIPENFLSMLPNTVTSLTVDLMHQEPKGAFLSPLPPHLLLLRLTIQKLSPETMRDMYGLRQLQQLELETSTCISLCPRDSVPPSGHESLLLLNRLPSSLKKIYIIARAIQESLEDDTALEIPIALQSLHLPWIPLNRLERLHSLAPQCHWRLQVQKSITGAPEGQFLCSKFASLLYPTFDVVGFINTINHYYTSLNARFQLFYGKPFQLTPLETKHVVFFPDRATPAETSVLGPKSFFFDGLLLKICPLMESFEMNEDFAATHYSCLWRPPPTLTRLDLHESNFRLDTLALPASLTWLSSRARSDARKSTRLPWPFTHMKHLDTPFWDFNGDSIGNLQDLEVFRAQVDLADYNVIEFLKLARKARSNMDVAITYYVTGALITDQETDEVGDVDWLKISAMTESVLRRQLAMPMPLGSESEKTELDLQESGDTDLVGRGVRSLREASNAFLPADICLPSWSRSVRIDLPHGFNLVSNHLARLSPQPNGLRPQGNKKIQTATSSAHSPLADFLPAETSIWPRGDILVSLTLLNVIIETHWIDSLPKSLRFLYLSSQDLDAARFSCFPPKLETLIVDDLQPQSETENRGSEVLFPSLSILPATLRHLAFLSWNLSISDSSSLNQSDSIPDIESLFTSDTKDSETNFLPALSASPRFPHLKTVLFRYALLSVLREIRSVQVGSPIERFEVMKVEDDSRTLNEDKEDREEAESEGEDLKSGSTCKRDPHLNEILGSLGIKLASTIDLSDLLSAQNL